MIWIVLLMAQASAPAQTTQTDRGQALFLDAEKGCAICHALKGKGTAVGPDLTGIGRLAPAAIAMGVRATATQYVQIAKLKSGESFPTMPGKKDEKGLALYDLSKRPPELHVVDEKEVSFSANENWKHPPAVSNLTDQEIADVIAYIRYAATGLKKTVTPDEAK